MNLLFIDSWTKGIRNFERLTPEIETRGGVRFKLLHLESWSASNVPSYQTIKGIECYDIKYYKTKNLYKVLNKEQPDAVIILSLSYIFDRTIVSMCQSLNIKVYYLAHGRFALKEGVGHLSSSVSIFKKILYRIKPYKIYVFLNYSYFNLFVRFRPGRIVKTLYRFVSHTDKTEVTLYDDELAVNRGMVYFDSEKEMFENNRQFPSGMIVAVGNPEMDAIINGKIIDRNIFLNSINVPTNRKYALYLDDGFVQSKIMSEDEWIEFLNDINGVLRRHDFSLVVKLHPRTDENLFQDYFHREKVFAIKDADFKNIVYHSDLVVGHDSTTVIYGLYLNKPIILSRWGKMSNLKINYPRDIVNYSFSIDEFESMISKGVPIYDTKQYLYDYYGVKDGKSIKQIVDIILS